MRELHAKSLQFLFRVQFSHVSVFSDSRNVQKRATQSDTLGHCLGTTLASFDRLSVADREDPPTELLKDCHWRAVEKRSTARRIRLQSDMELKKAVCANISHVYPIFICLEQR